MPLQWCKIWWLPEERGKEWEESKLYSFCDLTRTFVVGVVIWYIHDWTNEKKYVCIWRIYIHLYVSVKESQLEVKLSKWCFYFVSLITFHWLYSLSIKNNILKEDNRVIKIISIHQYYFPSNIKEKPQRKIILLLFYTWNAHQINML